jgi:hypothetical protein
VPPAVRKHPEGWSQEGIAPMTASDPIRPPHSQGQVSVVLDPGDARTLADLALAKLDRPEATPEHLALLSLAAQLVRALRP